LILFGDYTLLKIDLQHLQESRQGLWLAIDFIMLGLLSINLLLIIIDSLHSTGFVSHLIQKQLPSFSSALNSLHDNFLLIDLVFVVIFLTEFLLRWFVAAQQNHYERWFFFPFIHWYDLLGCIPLGSTRLLRFLRVFSIIYRLHHYRIIDFTHTRVFRFLVFYYNVFLEELSDRVVAKVLSGIQEDLREDSQLGNKFLSRIIEPRMPMLALNWDNFAANMALSMRADRDNALAQNIRQSVGSALHRHADMQRIQSIPIIGFQLSDHLKETIAEVVVDAIANILEELSLPPSIEAVKQAIDNMDKHSKGSIYALDKQIVALIIDILELTKEQVNRKTWKADLNQQPSSG
jgi:hypothetical protein